MGLLCARSPQEPGPERSACSLGEEQICPQVSRRVPWAGVLRGMWEEREDLGEESGVCPESGDNDIVDSARN